MPLLPVAMPLLLVVMHLLLVAMHLLLVAMPLLLVAMPWFQQRDCSLSLMDWSGLHRVATAFGLGELLRHIHLVSPECNDGNMLRQEKNGLPCAEYSENS